MSSGKYTRETGDGYGGIYTTGRHNVELSICTHSSIEWTQNDDVVAIDHPDDPGIQLLEATETSLEAIDTVPIRETRNGKLASVRTAVLSEFEEWTPGSDVRVYERDTGLTLVLADSDPFVDGGDC